MLVMVRSMWNRSNGDENAPMTRAAAYTFSFVSTTFLYVPKNAYAKKGMSLKRLRQCILGHGHFFYFSVSVSKWAKTQYKMGTKIKRILRKSLLFSVCL